MRSRIVSTLAALAVGAALTAGAVSAIGSALGGGSDKSQSTTTDMAGRAAGKIMSY